MAKTIKDYYAILRIPPHATQEEIRVAYRQMARTFHPDINPAPDAEERFREINEAYEILADPDRRKSYDFFAVSGGEDDPATPAPSTGASPTPTPAAAAPPPEAKQKNAAAQRIFPPTWAILLIVLGVCIIVSVGVGALLSLRRNRPTGGAESANVNKLTTFISPPAIPENITVVQESGTPVITARPNNLNIAGTIYPVVPVTPEEGRWPLPQDQDAVAVWIYGTVINYVIGLPFTPESESLLAGLSGADRVSVALDNGSTLVFGSPQAQRVAASDLSPMGQGKPGVTLVLLGSDQANRLVVQARYLPEESLFAEDQRVDNLRVEVLRSSIPEKSGDMLQFVVEYQLTNEKVIAIDPAFFDMILEDSSGQFYMLNENATSLGEFGRLSRPVAPGETVSGSAGYLVPADVPGPLTWVFRSDATSANSASFVLPYQPPKPGPAVPDVILAEVFDDAPRSVIVINGTVYNDGESPLTVTLDKVNLTSGQGGSSLQASTPLLPWTIEPGGSQGFELQFSRPADVDSVLLEMLGFSYRIEGLQQ